jgi:hypothetical protein
MLKTLMVTSKKELSILSPNLGGTQNSQDLEHLVPWLSKLAELHDLIGASLEYLLVTTASEPECHRNGIQ